MGKKYAYGYDENYFYTGQIDVFGVFDEDYNEIFTLPPMSTWHMAPDPNNKPRFDVELDKWFETIVPEPPPEHDPNDPPFDAEVELAKLREELLKDREDLKGEIKSLKEEVTQWKRINSDLSSSLQRTRYYLTLALPGASHLFRD